MRRLMLVALAAAGIAGCYRARTRVVSGAALPDRDGSMLTNFLSAPLRPGMPSEQTPGSISRAAIADEAWIESLDDGKVCLRIVVRTAAGLDSPLGDWRLELNAKQVWPEAETVTVRDWPYTGERDLLVADAVGASAFAALRIAQPEEKIFRVVERAARVCAATPRGTGDLTLSLVLPQDDRRGHWGETFRWQFR